MDARIVPALFVFSLLLLAFDVTVRGGPDRSTVAPGGSVGAATAGTEGGPRAEPGAPGRFASDGSGRIESTRLDRAAVRTGAHPPPSYQVEARVIAGGGGRASSANFTSVASLGQSTTGTAESASFRQHVGYLSALPMSSVPLATGCISFENLATGSVFVVGDGFRSGGFDLEVGDFVLSDGSTITTGDLTVGTAPPDFLPKPGKEAFTDNATLQAAFDSTQQGLTFLYRDFAGTVNLGVNGTRRTASRMDSLDGATIGGASVSVRPTASGGSFTAGFVTLEGPVDAVAIGGQEFILDDICVGCITFEDLAVGSSFSQGATVATSGFDVALEEFTLGNGDPAPGDGTLTIANDSLVGFHTGNKAWTDNVVLAPQLPAPAVDSVRFKYNTAGGTLNLRVNGALANGITDFMVLDGQTLGGAQIAVDSLPASGPGSVAAGVVTVSGSLDDIAVGGQELWIDDFCVPNRGGDGGGENGPPTAVIDSFATQKDQTLLVPPPGVLGNDSDPEGDPLNASVVSDVSNGSLILSPTDGAFEYDPDPGFVGTDVFFYEATDLGGRADTAQVTIRVLAEGECPRTWDADVTATDIEGNTRTVTVGQGPEATGEIDPACGESELPPTPPNDLFDVRLTGATLPGVTLGNGTATDIRPSDTPTPAVDTAQFASAIWRMELQTNAYPITLAWDAGSLADALAGRITLAFVNDSGDLIRVNMKERSSTTVEDASVEAVEIRLDREITRTVPTVDGWALVSLPLEAPGQTFSDLLPACETGFVYEPGSGYAEIGEGDPVPAGRGFFANCSGGPSSVTGRAPDTSNVGVGAGWNALGPFAEPVAASAVTSEPSGLIETPFFGFDTPTGYQAADTLRPGKAYWIRTSEAGSVQICCHDSDAARPDARVAHSVATTTSRPGPRLTLTGAGGRKATLRFAPDLSAEERARHALPPVPPSDLFDVRFASGHSVAPLPADEAAARATHTVELQGLSFPVELQLESGPAAGTETSLRVSGIGNRSIRLTAEAPTATIRTATDELRVGADAVPNQFALKKSHPNPARDRATIDYALPKETRVTLEVYDVLGRRVARLVDDTKPAGHHRVQVDAAHLPSGTYFVRMRADTFTKTRRMTVVR